MGAALVRKLHGGARLPRRARRRRETHSGEPPLNARRRSTVEPRVRVGIARRRARQGEFPLAQARDRQGPPRGESSTTKTRRGANLAKPGDAISSWLESSPEILKELACLQIRKRTRAFKLRVAPSVLEELDAAAAKALVRPPGDPVRVRGAGQCPGRPAPPVGENDPCGTCARARRTRRSPPRRGAGAGRAMRGQEGRAESQEGRGPAPAAIVQPRGAIEAARGTCSTSTRRAGAALAVATPGGRCAGGRGGVPSTGAVSYLDDRASQTISSRPRRFRSHPGRRRVMELASDNGDKAPSIVQRKLAPSTPVG